MHPHNGKLPPPYFTVGMMCSGTFTFFFYEIKGDGFALQYLAVTNLKNTLSYFYLTYSRQYEDELL